MKKDKIRVGIIGAGGTIGRFHTHLLAEVVPGAEVVLLQDIRPEVCGDQSKRWNLSTCRDGNELIHSPEVEAVVIASWDETHADYVRECLAAGKPVFCEKPLATNVEDAIDVLEAAKRSPKASVQVGFMRRFDPYYVELKAALDSGDYGAPLMMHCVSRTPAVDNRHTSEMHVTNIVIHEIDCCRWLLGEDLLKGQMVWGRSTGFAKPGLADPQLALMWSQSGVLIDVEAAANAHYGYEIGCEVVCEKGTLTLGQPPSLVTRFKGGYQSSITASWQDRFAVAYEEELSHWIEGLHKEEGTSNNAPGVEDGFQACLTADALLRSIKSKQIEQIQQPLK